MTAESRFGPEALRGLREAIRDAGGSEVLAIGSCDAKGRVTRLEVAARGNAQAVPALRPFIEKGQAIIHNHPSGALEPSAADLSIASAYGEQGLGFFIVDNAVERVYVVAEPIAVKRLAALAPEALAGMLEPGGKLSSVYKDYEQRDSQVELLEFICRGFNRGLVQIAEAGTGVGKSLAYLIPVFDWIFKNAERVVVSTATINLQQQLMEKDIPLVAKLFGRSPRACLVKGRGNYLCLNRLWETLEDASLFREENEELGAIRAWSQTTDTGSRSDLSFYPADEVWSRVCSEADACYGLRCAYREGCFVLKARREAASANLLVVNHHLLFSDLALRLAGTGFEGSAVLPAFRHIVFDEAHNVEKSATSFFSISFSRAGVGKAVSRLFRRRKNRSAGLLVSLEKAVGRSKRLKAMRDGLLGILELAAVLEAAAQGLLNGEGTFRLCSETSARFLSLLAEPLKELRGALNDCANQFEALFSSLGEREDRGDPAYECRVQLRRLLRVAEMCERFLRAQDHPGDIFWLEAQPASARQPSVRFVITPLDVARVMQEAVYGPYRTILFTSATLTMNGSFDFWKARVGIAAEMSREVEAGIFSSPFNYRQNVLLAVPAEAPAPDQEGYEAFVGDFVKEVLLISEGHALVLFTSYALLQSTYLRAQAALKASGIPLLRQGEEDRSKLLSRFKELEASVLFATDSFWEGVDAPGETLEVLILSRLPFRVPSDPILQARMEALKQRGGNPFWDLALPDAVMRLKQGFGRLMRKKTDWGVVLILDSRVATRQYGSFFLASLPETRKILAPSSRVLEVIEDFMARMRCGA